MSVEKLTDDYLQTTGSSGNSGFFGDSNVEAPAMFKRNGFYYAVFGSCCCYCEEGSSPIVYVTSNPLGPYTTTTNLGGAMSSQQTNILPYNTPNGIQYLWQGDHWQSAPDGLKGHDFSYWQPLSFGSDGNVTGPLQQIGRAVQQECRDRSRMPSSA
eukprot:TRINITY_DN24782_c0_g1_i4.p1 TRINITY_DN24782_c0_g1~~TRINITY_DN24782_c0_g1_i4.p1  ORF type:complete len:156 (+),score=29.23 TRINITY_DN24782_c0_g1_i4:3-470(+)